MPSPTTWGPTTSFAPTGSLYLNGLLGGTKWGGSLGQGTTLTYSFAHDNSYWSTNAATGYGRANGDGEPWDPSYAGSTATERAIIKTALNDWSRVATISFNEVADTQSSVGEMRFGFTTIPTAHAYFPGSSATAGDVWFGRHMDGLGSLGTYEYATVLHEIGHALGLKHPHEQEGGFNPLPGEWNSMEFSIMSYRSYVGASDEGGYRNETAGYAQSPMMYDILAMQHLYGANFGTNSGNTVYRWNPGTGEASVNGVGQGAPEGNRVFETIWDGGGVDTYDFSNYATNLSVSLVPGSWSLLSGVQRANLGDGHFARGNVFNAFQYKGDARSLIENAKGGSGHDAITGNAANNVLAGNGGSDTLDGGTGADTLWGGGGNDVLIGGAGQDEFVFDTALNASANVDTIRGFSHADDLIWLENAVFTSLGAGALQSGALANWDAADQADDRIVYRHVDTGDADTARDTIYLYYDATGGSTADAVVFAMLTNQASVSLDASDFRIY